MTGPRPMFLDGTAGRLFAVHWPGDGRRTILFLPAFGEEMNRSRRMVTLLAHALAARGIGLLALDPFGTGDSEGDFAQARWEQWLSDAGTAAAWLRDHGQEVLWAGLRTGAALALAAARIERAGQVMLWQPVLDGTVFLNQLLRVRVAAGLGAEGDGVGGAEGDGVGGLRARLAAGETVEIGGLPLAPAMADALDHLRMEALVADWPGRILWFQIGGGPSVTQARRWRPDGREVAVVQVSGPPFWAIEETVAAPELLAATVNALTAREVAA